MHGRLRVGGRYDLHTCLPVIFLMTSRLERHIVVGVQNQFLTLYKQEAMDELIPCAVLRGHQRSVECVAANSDGGYIDQSLIIRQH